MGTKPMDIFFAILMIIALSNAMQRNGTWKSLTGLGDAIALFVISLMAIALVRFPIYLMWYGWIRGPYHPSSEMQLISGFAAVAFWWCMAYWRIPGKLWRLAFPPAAPKNPYPRMPRIDGPTP